MPAQTVHLPTEAYRYVMDTADESISGRIAELVNKGIEMEQSANGENEDSNQ